MKQISNLMDWVRHNLVKTLLGIIGFISSLFSLVQILRGSASLGIVILLFSLWFILVFAAVYVAFYTVPSEFAENRRIFKYPQHRRLSLISIALLVIILIGGVILKPSRSFVITAFLGTPTPLPSSTPTPTTTATLTPTPMPAPTNTPSPDELTLFVTIEEGHKCEFIGNQRSILDVGINNNSDRNVMLTSVKLIPENIYGCVYAGELPPVEAYQVIIDQWHKATFCGTAAVEGSRPEPIFIKNIPQNKYTIFQHQTERFQITLGLTDSNYYLSGAVYLEIETDSGKKLLSGPHEIAVCVPDKYSFDDSNGVSSVMFSPEGNTLVAGYNDGSLILWDTDSREIIAGPFIIHSSPVKRLAFTSNGELLVVAGNYGEILISTVRDLSNNVRLLVDETGGLLSLAVSPKGDLVAAGGAGKITIWDVRSSQIKTSLSVDSYANILDLVFNEWATKLAAGDSNGTYYVLDVESGAPSIIISTSPAQLNSFSSVDIHLTTNRFVAADPITLFNLTSWGSEPSYFEQENNSGRIWGDWVSSIVFNNSGTQIASGKGNQIMLWDPDDARQTGILFSPYAMDYLSIAYNNQDDLLAAGSLDGSVIIWDVVNQKLLSKLVPPSDVKPIDISSLSDSMPVTPQSPLVTTAVSTSQPQVWSRDEIFRGVAIIVADELGVDVSLVTLEARFYEDLGADDLDVVELIMAYEDKFNIMISDEDASQIVTVGDAVTLIEVILRSDW